MSPAIVRYINQYADQRSNRKNNQRYDILYLIIWRQPIYFIATTNNTDKESKSIYRDDLILGCTYVFRQYYYKHCTLLPLNQIGTYRISFEVSL